MQIVMILTHGDLLIQVQSEGKGTAGFAHQKFDLLKWRLSGLGKCGGHHSDLRERPVSMHD